MAPTRQPAQPNLPPQRQSGQQLQAHVGNTAQYPVVSYNGTVGPDPAVLSQAGNMRRASALAQHRWWTNLGYQDIQLHNGMGRGQLTGKQYNYLDQMYVVAFIPRIPGQTRGDAGGFHKRGPSSYMVQDWLNAGPGSQPEHPGGPGTIAGQSIMNPMTS